MPIYIKIYNWMLKAGVYKFYKNFARTSKF
jgi:hypothetical protein